MKRTVRLGIVISLVVALSACQTLEGLGPGGSSPLDPRLANSHSAQFFSKSGFQACAVGAITGALACQLGNPSNRTSCMLIAAAAGCGVGMGANYYMDYQRSQYANTEDRLDAAIADVRKDNQALQSLADTARQVIADDRQKMEKIRREIASKTVQRSQAEQQLAEVDANTAYLKKLLADVQNKQQEWETVAAAERSNGGARLDLLQAEIHRLKQQRIDLETEVDQMYAQRSAIQLG